MEKSARSILATPGGRTSIRRPCCGTRSAFSLCPTNSLFTSRERDGRRERLARFGKQLQTPVIQLTGRTRATDRASRVTGFVTIKLFAQIGDRVRHQILRPNCPCLRAPVHFAK